MNISSELVYNDLAYVQSKPNSLCIHLSCLAEETKKLEKFLFVLFFDTDSWINDLDLNHSVLSFLGLLYEFVYLKSKIRHTPYEFCYDLNLAIP